MNGLWKTPSQNKQSEKSVSPLIHCKTSAVSSLQKVLINLSKKASQKYFLAPNVKIKDNCFIGASTTIIQGINIEKDVIVGAGSIIIRDIPEKTKIVGNPGREIHYWVI